jgi:hypothetical protein
MIYIQIRLARSVCWRKLALGPYAQVFDSSYRQIWSLREIWRIFIANSCLFMAILEGQNVRKDVDFACVYKLINN